MRRGQLLFVTRCRSVLLLCDSETFKVLKIVAGPPVSSTAVQKSLTMSESRARSFAVEARLLQQSH